MNRFSPQFLGQDAADGLRPGREIVLLAAVLVERVEEIAGKAEIDRLAVYPRASLSRFFGIIC